MSKLQWFLVAASACVIVPTAIALLGGGPALVELSVEFLQLWKPILLVLLVLAGASLYLLPTIVAHRTGHHNAVAITVLNLFLGWTLLGWVGALVWSCMKPRPANPGT